MTDYQTPERMAEKEKAIPVPNFEGKRVLDVGCDHGYWSFLSAERGAEKVVGLDRGRRVKGVVTDLAKLNREKTNGLPCEFHKIDLGHQWHEYGIFDVVLCFSMYHHFFQNCLDHEPVWYWLWRHTSGELLWENPTGEDDPVVRQHVTKPYIRGEILEAAERYFEVEYVGPALHVPTREVWRCTPLKFETTWQGMAKDDEGPGGATRAFRHAGSRRIDELRHITGRNFIAGSLNVWLDQPFDWDAHFYRSLILDAKNRSNIDGEWVPRWLRLYPVEVNGFEAFAFRFEDEDYPQNFAEFVSGRMLRETTRNGRVHVRSC